MKIKKTIYLNAGHFGQGSSGDPGARGNGLVEREEAIKIRDLLVPLLRKHFYVFVVPDCKNLKQSVASVNEVAKKLNDGIALSLHLNAGGGTGAECFYHRRAIITGKKQATILMDRYHKTTGLANRGARPDTQSVDRYLYWIHKTNPWALLLEMCFIDNQKDTLYFKNNRGRIAEAIYLGICDIYKIKVENKIELKNKISQYLDSIVQALSGIRNLIKQI